MAQQEVMSKRGLPALTKRSVMDKPPTIRTEFEKAALELSGLNRKEQTEYWQISETYDKFWDAANPEQRQGILDCLYYWRRYMEEGLSPLEANKEVIKRINEQNGFPFPPP